MLDNITKRRIDDCRDILVGKLPDPKSQIEQITIALIYKFMDDMDKEAIELGGKAKFFSDYTLPDPSNPEKQITVPFEKYSWDNLFDTKVSAAEMLKLYSEAIEGMVKNPNIPDLFANIFKNAYLPYRDPETLKMFLKTISEFEYTHSEKLGDAFEYLLSVMGSQGDAGQFRTPRHIFDFLVAAVNPGKNDTILDPACGTAGFLISAFKHIKEQNNNSLTPDEQKKLIKNFVGYDISPDMVRLSLVNLYLHGFSDPHIFEYDSLSSEQRWDETFDVVLANPPFMSPKGGIRPHKKFTISSNRSEVLFVDYIAEHLNPKGRAGIIVPEGVIFQSGTAYKALRKMLVDKYLYAVVSLPAGVFNPYSGVKTSILLMDADLSKKTKDVLFVKIDNDGYGLGAQRNAVKGGQLEEVVATLKTFKEKCIEGKSFENTTLSQAVSKTEIGKSGDYNLNGERYKQTEIRLSSYPIVELGSLIKVDNGRVLTDFEDKGSIACIKVSDMNLLENVTNIVTSSHWIKETSYSLLPINSIVFPKRGAAIATNKKRFTKIPCLIDNNCMGISVIDGKVLNPSYLFAFMRQFDLTTISNSAGIALINNPDIKGIKIPLPPLSIQDEIVAEIESYQKIIDGAKMVIENYSPRIEIDPSWEILKMVSVSNINPESKEPSNLFKDWFNYIDISCVENLTGKIDYNNKLNIEDAPSRARRIVKENDILLSTVRPNLKAFGFIDLEPNRFIASTGFAVLRAKENCIPKFLYYMVFQEYMINQMIGTMEKGAYPSINQTDINNFNVPLPNKVVQQQIVSLIEKEQVLVNANKQLIVIYEQKIKDRIAKVWGEKEQKLVSKKLSNDLYLAMMLKQMEKKIQLNYGEVATQKTVFHLNTFTNQKLDYPFMNSNYGTYSYQLKDDLLKNPYLTKTKKGNGEVFVVTSSKENEVLEALSNPDNKDFVDAINEVLNIYKTPLINKETENIELLNTVSKVILDKQTTDLEVVYKGMENWEINQNGFKTKADKFTKAKTKKMIGLIEKLGLVNCLIK